MKYVISLFISISLFNCTTQKTPTTTNHTKQKITQEYVPGELIVVFANNEPYSKTIKALEANNNISLINLIFDSETTQIAHFKVPKAKESAYIKIIQKHPNIKSVELNYLGSFN
jgi:hypothetical protein